MKAVGFVVMRQSAITFPLPGPVKLRPKYYGIEWEDMLCTIFHITQITQHEYTEGFKVKNTVTTRVIT